MRLSVNGNLMKATVTHTKTEYTPYLFQNYPYTVHHKMVIKYGANFQICSDLGFITVFAFP
jgi:hypothetical protein